MALWQHVSGIATWLQVGGTAHGHSASGGNMGQGIEHRQIPVAVEPWIQTWPSAPAQAQTITWPHMAV